MEPYIESFVHDVTVFIDLQLVFLPPQAVFTDFQVYEGLQMYQA